MTHPNTEAAMNFMRLLKRLMRSRTVLEARLPAAVVAARARLVEAYPGGKSNRADVELLYRVGELLAHRQEPVTMGELSRELGVPLSTATRIVDWLVRGEYAQRLPDREDRRVVRVELSPTGQEVYSIAQEMIRQQAETWLETFSPDEVITLMSLLGRLVDSMEKE